tara:strand:+ start:275 stop:961 length:687 start_codon:yes stop_codon:yes gene_type:complete
MRNFTEDIASIIRATWYDLPGIEPLEVDDELAEVHNTVDGDNLYIKNEMYKCPGLRKIHLETARLGNLDILHSVYWPDPKYKLPIFGCDLVSTPTVTTAAIVDVSPISGCDRIHDRIAVISDNFNSFTENRELPEWATVFSPHCKFMRLSKEIEKAWFYQVVMEYLIIVCDEVRNAQPGSPLVTAQRMADQIRYSNQQKKNDKTRRILEKCFNEEWADNYINKILFDA